MIWFIVGFILVLVIEMFTKITRIGDEDEE